MVIVRITELAINGSQIFFLLLHTMACFYVISCYVISEWRSHSWHYFLLQNSSKCKHTKNLSDLGQM